MCLDIIDIISQASFQCCFLNLVLAFDFIYLFIYFAHYNHSVHRQTRNCTHPVSNNPRLIFPMKVVVLSAVVQPHRCIVWFIYSVNSCWHEANPEKRTMEPRRLEEQNKAWSGGRNQPTYSTIQQSEEEACVMANHCRCGLVFCTCYFHLAAWTMLKISTAIYVFYMQCV